MRDGVGGERRALFPNFEDAEVAVFQLLESIYCPWALQLHKSREHDGSHTIQITGAAGAPSGDSENKPSIPDVNSSARHELLHSEFEGRRNLELAMRRTRAPETGLETASSTVSVSYTIGGVASLAALGVRENADVLRLDHGKIWTTEFVVENPLQPFLDAACNRETRRLRRSRAKTTHGRARPSSYSARERRALTELARWLDAQLSAGDPLGAMLYMLATPGRE